MYDNNGKCKEMSCYNILYILPFNSSGGVLNRIHRLHPLLFQLGGYYRVDVVNQENAQTDT